MRRPLLLEVARPNHWRVEALRAHARRERTAMLLAALLGFAVFMPYPALSVGNRSAIQLGNVLSLLVCLPALTVGWWRTRGSAVYPLIIAGVSLSALRIALGGQGDPSLCFKAVVVWTVSCLSIVAAQVYAPKYSLPLLCGIATATVLHVGVGLWQFIAFQSGEFPLLGLYVNPSFLSVQDNAEMMARWMRRPFGIFPEPSAMASSLAPWVLLGRPILAGLVRLKQHPATWQSALFATAAVGALGLIILSRSGHAAVTLLALMIIAGVWFVQSRCTPRAALALLVGLGVVVPLVVWSGASVLGDRLDAGLSAGNSSWNDRSSSLLVGFQLVTERSFDTALFGLGTGLSAVEIYQTARLEAVWSVLLTFIYEVGLLGMLVVFYVAHHLASVWRQMRFDLVFAAVTFVWIVGITLTTSYEQLLPLWLTLGWLTVWPSVCEPTLPATPSTHLNPNLAVRRRQMRDDNRYAWRPALGVAG